MAKSRLVGDTIPMQINGVSQQSDLLRLPNQVTEQINCISSLVDGVTKRPPTEFLKSLTSESEDWTDAKVHVIHRDELEKYIVVIQDDSIRVFNLLGEEHTVERGYVPAGNSSYFKLDKSESEDSDYSGEDARLYINKYLTPSSGFRVHTIADTTFITNRNQVVRMDPSLHSSGSTPYRALVWIKSLKTDNQHRITIGGGGVNVTVSWSQNADAKLDLTHTTKMLTRKLNEKFEALGLTDTWKAGYLTNILYIESLDTDFSIDVGHDWSDTYIEAIKDSVSGVADLPSRGFPGMKVKVTGDVEDGNQGFWVKFIPNDEAVLDLNSNGNYVVPVNLSSDFNSTDDEITISGHPFRSKISPDNDANSGGEREVVQYKESSSFSVGGLTDNRTYFVDVIDDSLIQLSVEPSSVVTSGASSANQELAGTVVDLGLITPKLSVDDSNPDGGTEESDMDYETASFVRLKLMPGKWIEDLAPLTTGGNPLEYKIDADTMPHVLIRSSKRTNDRYTFILAPANGGSFATAHGSQYIPTWGERIVGDDISASDPTFIGTTINDIFEWRDSLGFASDQSFVLSQRSAFMNFWPITVATSLDDARIDVAASGNNASNFHSVRVFQDELVGFTEDGQYTLSTVGLSLTPDAISLSQTTNYESSDVAQPVNIGSALVFATKRGDFSSVSEYFVRADQMSYVIENTRHIPHYIQGQVTSLSVSSVTDSLVCTSDTATDSIYIYQWFWHGEEKVQSSWSRWGFDSTIISASFFKDTLYIIAQNKSSPFPELYKLVLTAGDTDPNSDFKTSLDRRVHSSDLSRSHSSGETTVTLPYSIAEDSEVRAIEDYSGVTGRSISVLSASGDTVVLKGDYSSIDFYMGVVFDSQIEFSRPVMKDRYDENPDISSRLQIQNFSIYHEDTGHYIAKVYPDSFTATPYEYTMDNQLGSTLIDSPSLSSGVTTVPIRARAKDMRLVIHNDSHLPHHIVSSEWHARYNPITYRR